MAFLPPVSIDIPKLKPEPRKVHDLKIESPTGAGAVTKVSINGEPSLGITGLTLNIDADGINTAELRLVYIPAGFEGKAEITIPMETEAVLVKLGWTPPA